MRDLTSDKTFIRRVLANSGWSNTVLQAIVRNVRQVGARPTQLRCQMWNTSREINPSAYLPDELGRLACLLASLVVGTVSVGGESFGLAKGA